MDGEGWEEFNITPIPGFPLTWIQTIEIDQSDNKWIGTYDDGLVKYDGTNWTVYNMANSGLPSNAVQCITADQSNNLWIGVGYLVKFDGTNWTIYTTSNSGLPKAEVSCISIDESGNKWIGTRG